MRRLVVVALLAGCAPQPRLASTPAPAGLAVARTATVSESLELESIELEGSFLVVPSRPTFETMTRRPTRKQATPR